MNTKFLCYMTFIAIFLFGCQSRKNVDINTEMSVFDLTDFPDDTEPFQLSNIAESVRYIPLETNDSSVIGYIRRIVKKNDSYYILSGNAVLRFNNKGKFLSKLQKIGKGPGEYIGINDFDIDPSGQLIAICTWDKILFYFIDGSHYKTIQCNANYIDFIDSKKILSYRINMLGEEEYSHLIMNTEGDTIAKFHNRFKFQLKNSGVNLPEWEYIRYRFDDELFVSEIQDDTLFKVTKANTLSPHSIFYTGDHRITVDARSDGNYFQKHFSDFIYLTNILESSRYIFYSIQGKGRIFDKQDQISYNLKGFNNDIDGGVEFSPRYSFGKDIFISTIEAVKLKTHLESQSFEEIKVKDTNGRRRFEQLAKGLSEEDNPVIMIVKLKD